MSTPYIGIATRATKGITVHALCLVRQNGALIPMEQASEQEQTIAWNKHFPQSKARNIPEANQALRGFVFISFSKSGKPTIRQFPNTTDNWAICVERDIEAVRAAKKIGPWGNTNPIPPAQTSFYIRHGFTLYGPVVSKGLVKEDKHFFLKFEENQTTTTHEIKREDFLTFHKPDSTKPYHLQLVRKPVAKAKPKQQKAAPQKQEAKKETPTDGQDLCLRLEQVAPPLQEALFLPQPINLSVDGGRQELQLLLMQNLWVQNRLQSSLSASAGHITKLETSPTQDCITSASLPLLKSWMTPYFQSKLNKLKAKCDTMLATFQSGKDSVPENELEQESSALRDLFYAAEVLHIPDITYIYQHYCLYRLVEGILRLGFQFEGNARLEHPYGPAKGSQHLANVVHFRKEGTLITLYHEPAICVNQCLHGLNLFCDNLAANSHLTPDFVIKISGAGRSEADSYVVLDAKWADGENIKEARVLGNYSLRIRPYRQQDRVDMVWTFQGKPDPEPAKAYIGISSDKSGSTRALAYRNCIVREQGDTMDFFWQEFSKLLS